MQPDPSIPVAKPQRVIRAMLWLSGAALLFLALLQAVTVTVAWWRNELTEVGAGEWFWILLLPVLVGIYLRFFSILRPDCHACLPNDHSTPGGPHGP
jgi:hypothetical protein